MSKSTELAHHICREINRNNYHFLNYICHFIDNRVTIQFIDGRFEVNECHFNNDIINECNKNVDKILLFFVQFIKKQFGINDEFDHYTVQFIGYFNVEYFKNVKNKTWVK